MVGIAWVAVGITVEVQAQPNPPALTAESGSQTNFVPSAMGTVRPEFCPHNCSCGTGGRGCDLVQSPCGTCPPDEGGGPGSL